MTKRFRWRSLWLLLLLLAALPAAACRPADLQQPGGDLGQLKVLAVESFLADIAQNVAGDRLQVATLMPLGLDPHAFEPTPRDVAQISESGVLIVNGAGFEEWLTEVLDNAGGSRLVIDASAGLSSRQTGAEEAAVSSEAAQAVDPHFWLDPTKTVRYVENIRDGLSQADPAGKAVYAANAAAYIDQLKALDSWIRQQIEMIPPERRLLVTNHESFGYYADRYGLQVVGAVVPSISTNSSPSAQQLAALTDLIRSTGAPAIFLETGANTQLAQQLHDETGIQVVTGLYSHSVTPPDGPAPTYLDMLRYNTQTIVSALK